MLYLFSATLLLTAASLAMCVVKVVCNRRSVPRGYYLFDPEPWVEIPFGVLFTSFVVMGYWAYQQGDGGVLAGVSLVLGGGVGGVVIQSRGLFIYCPKPHKALSEERKQGWEVSFGRTIWTTDFRPSALSAFGWWRQALGLVHFVDGLEVLHFRAPCDNGGRIEVGLVLVPFSPEVRPVLFWETIKKVESEVAEEIKVGASRATSAPPNLHFALWVEAGRGVAHIHHDTEVVYFSPPERWKPFTPKQGR